jgi:hypothetical protein
MAMKKSLPTKTQVESTLMKIKAETDNDAIASDRDDQVGLKCATAISILTLSIQIQRILTQRADTKAFGHSVC